MFRNSSKKKKKPSLALSHYHIAMINDHEWGVDKNIQVLVLGFSHAFGNDEIINDEK